MACSVIPSNDAKDSHILVDTASFSYDSVYPNVISIPSPEIIRNDSLMDRQILLTYRFSSGENFIYQIIFEKDSQYLHLFSVLKKNDIEMDRNEIHLEQTFFDRAKVNRVIINPGINHINELVFLTSYEDNSEENMEGESSEDIFSETITFIFGRSGNLLTDELTLRSTDYYWYEGFDDFSSSSHAAVFLPDDENGLPDRLVVEKAETHQKFSQDENGQADTCENVCLFRKELQWTEGKWKADSATSGLGETVANEDYDIYWFPLHCNPEFMGRIYQGNTFRILEKSNVLAGPGLEDELEGKRVWARIQFKIPEREENEGYILLPMN